MDEGSEAGVSRRSVWPDRLARVAFLATGAVALFLFVALAGFVLVEGWPAAGTGPILRELGILLPGTVKTSLLALVVAAPLALGSALCVSGIHSSRLRGSIRLLMELMAGIPSVVLGCLALIHVSIWIQYLFGQPARLNALVAGLALGVALIPFMFTLIEEAMFHAATRHREAAFALGCTAPQVACRIVLPAALPGILAALVLGLGRATGETLIVLMTTGVADNLSWSLLEESPTLTSGIAGPMRDVVHQSPRYRTLYQLAGILLLWTFAIQYLGKCFLSRLHRRGS